MFSSLLYKDYFTGQIMKQISFDIIWTRVFIILAKFELTSEHLDSNPTGNILQGLSAFSAKDKTHFGNC